MTKRIVLLTFVLTMLTHWQAFSQATAESSCRIKGILVDSVSGETIPYGTVSVTTEGQPPVYLKRVAAGANGSFEITLAKQKKCILCFESVGMKKLMIPLDFEKVEKLMDLGKVKMSNADAKLSEVTVTALKPLVKVDIDKISYDTKSDPESKSNSVLEMLKKVPMVTVDGEDKIQLKGSSNFKVYMNGKPSNMVASNPSQVLKSIPASSIKNIEVITEPGAKYDAEGVGGIINIVTEKAMSGYTGTLRAGLDTRGGYNSGIYFSTKKGKFGTTANINYNKQFEPERSNESSRINLSNGAPVGSMIQQTKGDANYHFSYGSVEASYEIDTLNLLSFSVDGHSGGHKSNQTGFTQVADASKTSYYDQEVESKGTWGGIDLSLDYQRSFKKPDKLLTFSYKMGLTPDNSDNSSRFYNQYTSINGVSTTSPDSISKIKSNAQGTEHTFQLDYTEPFNKKHVIEAGFKYIIRLNNSNNTYQTLKPAGWMDILKKNADDMNHTQNILGAYASYTLKLKKFSIRGGLRLERTSSDVEFDQEPANNFKVHFTNLVPSVSTTFQMTDASNIRLSYNQRLSRPGIWYLNPFYDDSNPQQVHQGNPNLKSEIDNSFSLNYGLFTPKLNLNLSTFASFTDNSIESISKLLPNNIVYQTYDNIGSSKRAGLSGYLNWSPSQKFRVYLNGNSEYVNMSTNDGSGLKNDGWSYGLSVGTQVTIPWELKIGLNGGYYSSDISLQGKNSSFHYSSFSISKEFFKKKLNVTMRINDPFETTRKMESTLNTDYFTSKNIMRNSGRYFGFSATYRFGEMKEQVKKAQRGISNDDVKGGGGGGQTGGGGQK